MAIQKYEKEQKPTVIIEEIEVFKIYINVLSDKEYYVNGFCHNLDGEKQVIFTDFSETDMRKVLKSRPVSEWFALLSEGARNFNTNRLVGGQPRHRRKTKDDDNTEEKGGTWTNNDFNK